MYCALSCDYDRTGCESLSAIEHNLIRCLAQLSCVTLRAITMLAPNFCAWVVTREASSCPEIPVGKPG